MVANSNVVFHIPHSDSFHCSSQTTKQIVKTLKSTCQSAEGEHLKITILWSTLVLFTWGNIMLIIKVCCLSFVKQFEIASEKLAFNSSFGSRAVDSFGLRTILPLLHTRIPADKEPLV